jgi:hypothetical protein
VAYDIRPLSFAEILDRSFAVLRDGFSPLVGISLVEWIPYGLLLAMARPKSLALPLTAIILLLTIAPVAHAALVIAVSRIYLASAITVGEAYRGALPILAALIGTYLLIYILMIPLMLLLVIPALYFMICWALVPPVMIVEETYGMKAMSRSRALIRGSWWRTFGLLIVVGLITEIPAGALQFVWHFIPVVGPFLTAITDAVVQTYAVIALVIYYFDRRCRTEDFDLRLLAQQIRAESAVPRTGTSVG